MPLQFDISERVKVPADPIAQGVVCRRTENVEGVPNYWLRWTTDTGLGAEGWFTETEMLAVNPPLPSDPLPEPWGPSPVDVTIVPAESVIIQRQPARKSKKKTNRKAKKR